MYILGLTGPSGAGKSLAAKHLEARGFHHLDADNTARAVVEPGSECLKALAAAFGSEIVRADGSLDRKRLAELAFAGSRVEQLNAVTFPFIMKEMNAELKALEQSGVSFTVLDVPALYEIGADKICDRVMAVTAGRKLRIERIMARDGLTNEQASARVNAQPDDAFYKEKADFSVCSDGGRKQLFKEIDKIADTICGTRRHNANE